MAYSLIQKCMYNDYKHFGMAVSKRISRLNLVRFYEENGDKMQVRTVYLERDTKDKSTLTNSTLNFVISLIALKIYKYNMFCRLEKIGERRISNQLC